MKDKLMRWLILMDGYRRNRHFKSKGEITSSKYAEKCSVSDRTARLDLSEFSRKEIA
ncbi:MAG: hypothetical protein LBC68_00105 [Prevotellaceae bacterium]|jgi:Fic family protein|nr:hypothetical protein [Prevotellaceae bacterium]